MYSKYNKNFFVIVDNKYLVVAPGCVTCYNAVVRLALRVGIHPDRVYAVNPDNVGRDAVWLLATLKTVSAKELAEIIIP